MTDRRKFLKTMPVAAAGAVTAGSVSLAAAAPVKPLIDTRQRDAFPKAKVFTQFGETFEFYDDLIRGRVAMVNFMSIKSEEAFPVTAFMAKVADQLGEKLGKEVLIHSITTDPKNDTPKELLKFAQQYGLRDGWRFLTTSAEETAALSTRLYRHPPGHGASAKKVDIVFYGNGSAGVWGTFPVGILPEDAAERITWVMPRERPATLRQAGPRKIAEGANIVSHNREV